jgi:arsenite-transporting ATPase
VRISEYFGASKVLIVAGKGGVGKTTVGASLALAAGREGLDVLVIELDGRPQIANAFSGEPLGYKDQVLWEASPRRTGSSRAASVAGERQDGAVRGRRITPDEALLDYLKDKGFDKIGARLIRTGALEVVATTTPGIQDLLLLGKISHLERTDPADLIIIDAPAAGHALTFLKAAQGVSASLTGVGPLQDQAKAVLEMLRDESRTRVLLVTLAEETPVNEAIETAFNLEDEVGIKLAPVVVNARWPEIPGLKRGNHAADFRLDKTERQAAEADRLASELPLPQLTLPFLFTTEIGMAELEILADALAEQIEKLP